MSGRRRRQPPILLTRPAAPTPPPTTGAEEFYWRKQVETRSALFLSLTGGEPLEGRLLGADEGALVLLAADGVKCRVAKRSIRYVGKRERGSPERRLRRGAR